MLPEDWPEVSRIYRQGITTGDATFETEVPDWKTWDAAHLSACRFTINLDGKIVGWAALSPVSGRCVYGGVAEVSIYIDAAHRGRGLGKLLLDILIRESEAQGIWTLQAGIFPENIASIHLHKNCGFREVGRRERIGRLNGFWRDVVLMERRSPIL